uniref:Uncharacterized protein n=1 Tax=Marseillevirus LCMAC101 TaxID=2506602 RepID=A0A481YS09_9VIRU|nr:MAG: hypothetical protein LCMAC101_06380 [Marseillevirus LCMAC101]
MSGDLLGKVSARLDIDIDVYLKKPFLGNNFVKSESKIRSIQWRQYKNGKCFHLWTGSKLIIIEDNVLDKICYDKSQITIKSNNVSKTFQQNPGFTMRQLLNAVLEIEKISRSQTEWFEGVDAHHVWFEGLFENNGVYEVFWGS